jgi:hypothetical protein
LPSRYEHGNRGEPPVNRPQQTIRTSETRKNGYRRAKSIFASPI